MTQHPMKALRLGAGLSQRDLARVAGTHHPTIWKMEQGVSPLRVKYLRPIAKFFDVPMSSLAAPAQAIIAETPGELDELVDGHDAVCGASDPLGVVASWLGRDIDDEGVREWLGEIKETLKETS